MMLLFSAEWLRFRRYRNNLLVGWLLLLLLSASAWFAGGTAAAYRELERDRVAAWKSHLVKHSKALPESLAPESLDAARKAYEFGRGEAPPALRQAPGGLVLAVQQFIRQPFDVKVSIDSRHLDPRRGAPLGNPLLDSFGLPDFAVVAALLIPLAVIALSYGLIHDAREQGIWAQIRAQIASPLKLLIAGLAVRFLIVLGAASLASALAFALDPGAAWSDCLVWLCLIAIYTLVWILICGVFNLMKLSSAASALGLIALWMMLNVVAPACLNQYAVQRAPMPAREATVVKVRAVQHEAEERMADLLEDWYQRQPDQRPAGVASHTWPVSYVPKIIWQDRQIASLIGSQDQARTDQASILEPLLWMAPGLALCRAADLLAGADSQQYEHYAASVETLESRWRTILAPAVMSYRGLTVRQLREAQRLGQSGQSNGASTPKSR